MSSKHLVLAIYPDAPAAEEAAASLKDTAVASSDALGILVLNDKGELDIDKVGARSWGAGAGIGAVMLVLGPAALGVGLIGGTLAGGLHHKSLGMSDWEKEHLAAELRGGKAAVGALAEPEDSAAITSAMERLGGTVESFELSDDTLTAVSEATA